MTAFLPAPINAVAVPGPSVLDLLPHQLRDGDVIFQLGDPYIVKATYRRPDGWFNVELFFVNRRGRGTWSLPFHKDQLVRVVRGSFPPLAPADADVCPPHGIAKPDLKLIGSES